MVTESEKTPRGKGVLEDFKGTRRIEMTTKKKLLFK